MPTFAEQLKSHRGSLTQVSAAAAIGCPVATYRDWERGRRTPPGWIQRKALAEVWDAKIACDARSEVFGKALSEGLKTSDLTGS